MSRPPAAPAANQPTRRGPHAVIALAPADSAPIAPTEDRSRPRPHQRRIRDAEAARDPRPTMATLKGCTVEQIPYAEAKAIVTRYEWLGTMPPGARACYGLRTPNGELAGVAVFAPAPSPESRDLCGPEYRDLTICLARGACVHWAHPHAASFLISRACKLAAKQFGWRVVFAYADPTAGEVGAVYQAANWLYLGVGVGRSGGGGRWRFFSKRDGRWLGERTIRKRGLRPAALRAHPDWIPDFTPDKGRYVWFEGTWREKRDLRHKLKYAPQPYPRRRRRSPPNGYAWLLPLASGADAVLAPDRSGEPRLAVKTILAADMVDAAALIAAPAALGDAK